MTKYVALKSTNILRMLTITSIGLIGLTEKAYASEHPGKALHESANCMKCHAGKPYDPKKSDSYPKLVKAVTFCNENLNAGMFEDEVEQLPYYLNDTYYHHPK